MGDDRKDLVKCFDGKWYDPNTEEGRHHTQLHQRNFELEKELAALKEKPPQKSGTFTKEMAEPNGPTIAGPITPKDKDIDP